MPPTLATDGIYPFQHVEEKYYGRVVASDQPVLITGETGTGKNVVAADIHRKSPRHPYPCVEVSCALLPAEMVESLLFGHSRGAFTSAVANQDGYFREVENGTIIIDEVNSLPIATQGKLLQVLNSGEYRPLGSTKTMVSRARVIACSNQNLGEMVNAGTFREDLFYRLQGAVVQTKPLRERPDAIQPLAYHFLTATSKQERRETLQFGPGAIQRLQNHNWPGNIRELRMTVGRATLHADEMILAHDFGFAADGNRDIALPSNIPVPGTAPAGNEALVGALRDFLAMSKSGNAIEEVTNEMVRIGLEMTSGGSDRASKFLGIAPRTINGIADRQGFPRVSVGGGKTEPKPH